MYPTGWHTATLVLEVNFCERVCRPNLTVLTFFQNATNTKAPQMRGVSIGVPDRIRTYDLWLRKPTLYPAELRVRDKNRGYCNILYLLTLGIRSEFCASTCRCSPAGAVRQVDSPEVYPRFCLGLLERSKCSTPG